MMATEGVNFSESNPFLGKTNPVMVAAGAYWEAYEAAKELSDIERTDGLAVADGDLVLSGLTATVDIVETTTRELTEEEKEQARLHADLEIGPEELRHPEYDFSDGDEGEE